MCLETKISANLPQCEATSVAPRRSVAIDSKVIHSQTVANGSKIRSRFLGRLGISQNSLTCPSSPPPKIMVSCQVVNEPLKKDCGKKEDPDIHRLSTSPKAPQLSRKGKSVSFNNSVKIYRIPSRLDYSERIRNALWVGSTEMQFNYVRNVIEFTAEKWNANYCLEEEHFVLTEDGELIHPIHLISTQQNLNRHFMTVMSAQQQRRAVC